MNLKKILKEEATWYFLALAGLLILLYMGANVITDTYFYMISLNILIFLFSYMRFEKQKFERLSHQTTPSIVLYSNGFWREVDK